MDKNEKSNNILIKRKGLIKIMRKRGIKRISKGGEEILDHFILNEIETMLNGLKNEMDVKGKRILDKEVIESFIKKGEKKEEVDY